MSAFEGFVDVPGGRLWAQWAGAGPGVVLVHAGIADARMWDPQWDALAARHRVVRYDTRGFGRSETGDVPFANRADLVAVMDAAGLARAVLVGCSRAGGIVIDTALESPDRVAGLVWVCGGIGGLETTSTPLEAELSARDEARYEAKDWEGVADVDLAMWVDGPGQPAGRAPEPVRAIVRRMILDTLVQDKVTGQPVRLEPPAAGRLAEIRVPTLAIVGLLDESGPAQAAGALVAGIPGARRIDVPDVAHLPNLERPEWFTETLLAFLAEVGWRDSIRAMNPQPPEPTLERQATRVRVTAYRAGVAEEREDRLAGEEPLAIRAAGPGQAPVDVAITMRTPGHEAELAVGFLRSEGLIEDGAEITTITAGDPVTHARPDDEITVHLATAFDQGRVAERHFVATASCGICGKASLDEVEVRSEPIPAGPTVDPAVLISLPGKVRDAQAVFEHTGGLHAAGLFDAEGRLLALREDVGRHNALDKLIGSQLLGGGLPLHGRIVLLTGRAGFELVQKAAVAGAPVVAAVSAPTDLAVEAAERLGVTLVGFLRGDGFNVYARPDRIAASPA